MTETIKSDAHTSTPPENPTDSRCPKYDVLDGGVRRCVGTVRSTGERCKRNPGPWKTQCSKHGGNSPYTHRSALIRQNQALAVVALEKQGITEITDPVEAHLAIASKLYGLVEILETQVSALTMITNVDRQGTEAISAILAAYQTSLKDTAGVLTRSTSSI